MMGLNGVEKKVRHPQGMGHTACPVIVAATPQPSGSFPTQRSNGNPRQRRVLSIQMTFAELVGQRDDRPKPALQCLGYSQ
jgi:hypothetical protein